MGRWCTVGGFVVISEQDPSKMTLNKNSLPFNQFRQIIKGVGEILEDFELNFGSYCDVMEHLTVLEAVPHDGIVL